MLGKRRSQPGGASAWQEREGEVHDPSTGSDGKPVHDERRQRAALGNPVPARPQVGALGHPCAIQSESAASI